MRRFLTALVLLATPAFAQSGLVGQTYDRAIKGTDLDPARKSQGVLRQTFTDTLNGPQTPGRRFGSLIVFETCTAHLCAFQHSVIAIDAKTRALYSAVYDDDGREVVVPNPVIASQVDPYCNQNRCVFPGEE